MTTKTKRYNYVLISRRKSDSCIQYEWENDVVYEVNSLEQAIETLKSKRIIYGEHGVEFKLALQETNRTILEY